MDTDSLSFSNSVTSFYYYYQGKSQNLVLRIEVKKKNKSWGGHKKWQSQVDSPDAKTPQAKGGGS